VVNRWLAWIRLFSFDIKHIAGKKHGGLDGLSRRGRDEGDSDEEDENELEESIDADLAYAYTRVAGLNDVELGVAQLDDGELDDANLTYTHVSDLADDAGDEDLVDDAGDEDLADDAEGENAEGDEDKEHEEDDGDDDDDRDDVDDMPHDLKRVKGYLLMLERPVGMTDRAFNSFRQYALRFL